MGKAEKMTEPQGNKVYKRVLEETGADALFVSDETYKRYVAGFLTEGGYALADKSGTYLFTDARYLEAAEKLLTPLGVHVVESNKENRAEEYLKKYAKVAVPFSEITYAEFLNLQKSGALFADATGALRECAKVKTEGELTAIAGACDIAEEGLLKTLPQIKEGMTEREVAALLEYEMRALGADGTSFDTIVAFGAAAAVPHHETGDTKLKFGDEILIDFGCKSFGYCSDMTRTFLFGDDKKHEEFKKAYACVLAAQLKVLDELKAGMTGVDGDKIARDYLEAHGYGKYFTHSLGHGIGLKIHEFPSIRRGGEEVLADGMVFSDEPGVYVAGEYGIRIEDTVTMKNGKAASFMKKVSKQLTVL